MLTKKGAATSTSTSKSQLFHYFPEGKSQLLLAVAELQAERVLNEQRPLLDELYDWGAWEEWKELILRVYAPKLEHCPLAALTSQFPRDDARIRELVSTLYARWQQSLAAGLATMRTRGLLRPDANTDELATAVLVAVQGGVAMGMATGSLASLRAALEAALGHVRTYAATEGA